MLSEVFYWVFNMSISASIVGLIVFLLGKIRRIPGSFAYILWVIPFFRMWVPIGMTGKYSLMTLISKLTTRTVVFYEGFESFVATNYIMAANSYFPITYKVNLLEKLFKIASAIWIVVAVVLSIALFAIYGITKSELKNSRHLRDNIYISDQVTSPATYGILKPRIILPGEYEQEDLRYILLHETAHIKRGDNLWRIIAFLSAIIHWFNPLAWLFLRTFLEKAELACDERVLASCGEIEKNAYASALINCAESNNVFAAAFGGAKIHVRIGRILSYRKLSAFSTVCFIALALAIGYVLLTNAA